jgi:hypothetical protein
MRRIKQAIEHDNTGRQQADRASGERFRGWRVRCIEFGVVHGVELYHLPGPPLPQGQEGESDAEHDHALAQVKQRQHGALGFLVAVHQ